MNQFKTYGNQILNVSRNLYFAGLGVAVIGGDRTVKVFNGLVEKGRATSEKSSSGESKSANLKNKITGLGKAAGQRVQNGFNGVLDRVGVPNREEIRGLTRSVEQLTEKVASLQPKLAD